MQIDYRNNDAALTICQNNVEKTIIISDINQIACELTGFTPDDVVGKPLKNILPARISELLDEYVEFDNNNDVGAVLGKVQSFSIIEKSGTEKVYRIKVLQANSGSGKLFFSIVLRDTIVLRKNDAIRNAIKENFKGHEAIEQKYNLPNKNSIIKDIDLVKRYGNSGDIRSCFAVLQIDDADEIINKYGDGLFVDIKKHVAAISRQSLRPDDVLASLNNIQIGVLLVGIEYSSTRMVLNRLRWQIAANPFISNNNTTIGLSVSISFCNITDNTDGEEIITNLEKALSSLQANSKNLLLEVSDKNGL